MSNDDLQKKYFERLQQRKFDELKKVEPDKIHLAIGTNVIGSSKSIVTYTGLPKSGKTTFLSATVAAAISKKDVFGIKTFLYQDKPKIAYFDTEQSGYDFNRFTTRVKQFADIKRLGKNFDAFLCREDDPQSIIMMINAYLKNASDCGVLVIDGLLDLVNNMNDEREAKKIIRILKKWSTIHDLLIITVLHQGKGNNQTIGHLGSFIDRYSQSVLDIVKEKDDTMTLKAKMVRSCGGFDPINIYFNHHSKTYTQS